MLYLRSKNNIVCHMITNKYSVFTDFKVKCNKIWTILFCWKTFEKNQLYKHDAEIINSKSYHNRKEEELVFCLKLHRHLIETRDLRNAWVWFWERDHTLVNNVNSSSYVINPSPFLSIHLNALRIESLFRGFSFLIMSQKSLYDILSVQKT